MSHLRQGAELTERAQGPRQGAAHAGAPVQVRGAGLRHDVHDAARPGPAHEEARQVGAEGGEGEDDQPGEAHGEG